MLVVLQALLCITALEAGVAADIVALDILDVETADTLLTLLKDACQLHLGRADPRVHRENHLRRVPVITHFSQSYCRQPEQIGIPSPLMPPQKKQEFDE